MSTDKRIELHALPENTNYNGIVRSSLPQNTEIFDFNPWDELTDPIFKILGKNFSYRLSEDSKEGNFSVNSLFSSLEATFRVPFLAKKVWS